MAATKILDWVIYVLKCPRTQHVRYVGFTRQTPEQRLRRHINDALRRPDKNDRHRWVLSLVSIGLHPLIQAIEAGTGDAWGEAERRWIAFYRTSGVRLVNSTNGGEGIVGWGTPEQRSERGKKGIAARLAQSTHEERSAASKKIHADRTPEQRRANLKNADTPERRIATSRALKKFNLTRTFEQRSAATKKAYAGRTPGQRSAAARNAVLARWAKSTPEQRTAAAKHAVAAREAKRNA